MSFLLPESALLLRSLAEAEQKINEAILQLRIACSHEHTSPELLHALQLQIATFSSDSDFLAEIIEIMTQEIYEREAA